MTSTLLFLGGGAVAIPALRWAREAGLETVLADADPHARARPLADDFHSIPLEDGEAHAALVRRLAARKRVAILATEPRAFGLLAPIAGTVPGVLPPRRTLELLATPGELARSLATRGLAVVSEALGAEHELDVYAFFREGAFVPAGQAQRRTLPGGDVVSLQPGGLSEARTHAAYVLVERAARAIGLEHGPVQATLVEGPAGLALLALRPGFVDMVGVTRIARRVYGKSPLQAWIAHLAGAGGPFDEAALEPRSAAGWLALMPARAGLFAGIDGQARARTLPGVIELLVDEPGRVLVSPELETEPLGWVCVEGHDHAEVLERVLAARNALEVRIACRQVA